jgi:hypothetical protein
MTKFGIDVPAEETRGILQPKLKYKYRVTFLMEGSISREYTRNVITADRPKITYEEVQVHSYNSRIYLTGKHEWQMVNLTFRDDVQNNISGLVGRQIQRQVDHHNQVSALSGIDYKFEMSIATLTGNHGDSTEELDKWKLEGCFIQNVDYDQGDYAASDPIQVTISVRYDNALHFTGIGANLMPTDVTNQTD